MTQNIHQQVWRLISQDYSVQKDLRRNLVNVRALAKFLIKEHHLEASVDAVISAIRRYDNAGGSPEFSDDVNKLLRGINIFTRDRVASITVVSQSLQKMFMNEEISAVESSYRIIKSKKYAIIFFNQDDLEKMKRFFPKDKIVDLRDNLAEIRIVFPPGGESIRGVLSRMLNEIAMRGVSISDFLQCYPEVNIYVTRNQLLEAHHAVIALHDEASKSKVL
ncbi:MAG: hypothetical protein KJ574_00305 [Nanoarchaeota archaeon]|nr:hypothetical protein [Nanoarchaeota archaeon]